MEKKTEVFVAKDDALSFTVTFDLAYLSRFQTNDDDEKCGN